MRKFKVEVIIELVVAIPDDTADVDTILNEMGYAFVDGTGQAFMESTEIIEQQHKEIPVVQEQVVAQEPVVENPDIKPAVPVLKTPIMGRVIK